MHARRIPVRADVTILLDKRRHASRHNSNRKCQCEPRFSHQIQPQIWSDIDFVQKTTTMKFAQPGFFAFTEIKEKVPPIIFSAERRRYFRLGKSELLDAGDVAVTKCTQFTCNLFRVFDFRTNQPEGEDKWKGCNLSPSFRQVPIVKAFAMFRAKTNRLVTDEKMNKGRWPVGPADMLSRGPGSGAASTIGHSG